MANLLTPRVMRFVGYKTKLLISNTQCLPSSSYNLKLSCQSTAKKDDTILDSAEKLLENSVVDIQNSVNSDWSSEIYPKCEVSARSQAQKRLQTDVDPRGTTVMLFPGQGSQYVGMGKTVVKYPVAEQVFESASNFLGYDLLELCTSGPKNKLDSTEYSQPAVYVLSLATVEHLRLAQPDWIKNCIGTAGFSVGEISALVFAGAISFLDGLKLIQVRAKAMQAVCDRIAGGMITVFYGPGSQLEYACLCARKWCLENGLENPECKIANYLFPHCKVVAGNLMALEFIENNYQQFKLKRVKRLPVSGAFHTAIMQPAAQEFKKSLMEITLRKPKFPVYSNVDGKMYQGSSHILRQLPKQIYKSVKWEQTLHILYERKQGEKFPQTIECGPGSSLKSCLKMVNNKAWNTCTSVEL